LETTILISEFFVFGDDFEHLGDGTLKTRETLDKALNEFEFYKKYPALKKENLRKLGVCSYEAESNIVIHAKFGIIKTYANENKIKTIAKDIGPGIPKLLLALTPGFSTASEKARKLGFGAGMGLKNIQKISDFFIITSKYGKGTYLTFEIWNEEINREGIKMKIKDLIKELQLEILTKYNEEILEKNIEEAYACDLLSRVLAKANEESTWITIQTNVNVVGVAVIKRVPIIIITEGEPVPEETIKKAEENSIIIARTLNTTFELSGKLYTLLEKETK
jgi:anti-sigma regulatory factor (Ser/Thr protein kinase)